MRIIRYKDARDLGLSKYFTGIPCKRGHIAERNVSNRACSECVTINKATWKDSHPEGSRLHQSKYRATKLCATPDWLTGSMVSDIEGLYKSASEKDTPHHVDHIVPLQGVDVCGLHVPWNLQVIPARDNLKKSNNYDQD